MNTADTLFLNSLIAAREATARESRELGNFGRSTMTDAARRAAREAELLRRLLEDRLRLDDDYELLEMCCSLETGDGRWLERILIQKL